MKKLIFATFLLVTTGLAAQADEPPTWMQQVFTGQELEAAWQAGSQQLIRRQLC